VNPSTGSGQGTPARITITDITGKPVAQLTGPVRTGLNRAQWNMTAMAASASGAPAGRGGGGGRGGGALVPPGDYLVTLEISTEKQTKIGKVRERIW
jgi:hypothetical protein